MKKLLGIIAISAVFSIVLMGCKGAEEGDTAATTGGTPATSTTTGTGDKGTTATTPTDGGAKPTGEVTGQPSPSGPVTPGSK